jgi:hypothetical protein
MAANGLKLLSTIGFLTVCEYSGEGLFGGYLVLNTAGRPLEFHCTAPVRPNRAQRILYGPTLKPFLYGEHIGRTLLSKTDLQPLFICTDVEPALSVRQYVSSPVVLVTITPKLNQDSHDEPPDRQLRIDPPHVPVATERLLHFPLGAHQLAVCNSHQNDRENVTESWRPFADDFDLTEPFGRIREAIEEARRRAK